jgi:DNA-binding response OmpR family regulator
MDDNKKFRHMVALALGTVGFAVREAGTELELQRILRRTRPDALLIDLQRSAALGIKVLARMRARASLGGIPIVFLAGTDADDFRQQAARAGADWFGLRPLGMVELRTRLLALVDHGHTAQRAPTRKRVS